MPVDRATGAVDAAVRYARTQAPRFIRELMELIRIPSVGGDPAHEADLRRAAEWLANALRAAGMTSVSLVDIEGAPSLVFAEWRRHGAEPVATILIYGHYDVQPPGPAEAWQSPPFEPLVRDGGIVGRGATDDKGQLLAHVKAVESYARTSDGPPVNIVCLFEGQEETGDSAALQHFLDEHGPSLSADAVMISDSAMRGPGRPAVTYGLRGKGRFELVVRRLGREVHPGNFAGALIDPCHALAQIVASLRDDRGRVAIPGFYDRVRPVSHVERSYMERVGPGDVEILAAAGIRPSDHEVANNLYVRTTSEPALAVTQFDAGDSGEPDKSSIPTRASATIEVRTVPDQDADDIARLVRAHARRMAPPGAFVGLRVHSSSPALLLDPRHPARLAAARAATATFGMPAVFLRSGGSIPIVNRFDAIGIAPVLLGFALWDDGLHAPNEHFSLDRFARATECSIRFLSEAARMRRYT